MPRVPIKTPAGHAFLDIREIVATRRLPAVHFCHLDAISVQADMEEQTGDLLLKLGVRVAGKEFDSKTVSYPATCWDHFKRDHLPTFTRWFLSAPRIETVEMTADAFYPSLRIPNHKPFVQVTLRKNGEAS